MKILIAEDELVIANSLKKNLELAGYTSEISLDGASAVNELGKNKYDLLLLDWKMPQKSGLEVCRDVRAMGISIPVILLTVLSDISNKVDALNAGADDYITKPFSFEEVLARIEAVLRRTNAPGVSINCGSFNLNLVNHTAETGGGKSVRLSDKEFELLNYLVNNKGTIAGRESLHKAVWGISYYTSTNFVDVTVKNLRKKLEELTGRKLIKSVYGEGYVFIGE